jgi:hypothetical protein
MSPEQEDPLIERLNRASVTRRIDPYLDIAWDDPTLAVDPVDVRWRACLVDGVAATDWFASLAPDEQARFSFLRVCSFFRSIIDFESMLQQGLLAYAETLDPTESAFRYLYHEIAEEAQHSQMFAEFLARAGRPIPSEGLTALTGDREVAFADTAAFVATTAIEHPTLYFMAVLSAEEPADDVQRHYLAEPVEAIHPLLRRICQVHVADEARHVSFARSVIRSSANGLTDAERRRVQYALPHLVSRMARRMTDTPRWLLDEFDAPEGVTQLPDAVRVDDEVRARSVRKIVAAATTAGLLPDRLRPVWDSMRLLAA